MLSPQEVDKLLKQARRNEEILGRLDEIERFLLARHELGSILRHLGPRIAQVYQLEAVTLAFAEDNQRLQQSLGKSSQSHLPGHCFWRNRKELRLLLGDLEAPYLSNKVLEPLSSALFPQGEFVASVAVAPLWVRGELLGTLNLGSASPSRYQPGLETDFLRRLGQKVALGLDAALLLEQSRLMERREVAVEMAGAACHELSQPVTTLGLLVAKILRGLPPDSPQQKDFEALGREVDRVGELVKRISKVSEYVTRPYAQGLKIIDVDAASATGAQEKKPRGEKRS
ncbi:MAG: DUF484 family protein [Desulfarculaceae bacterium]